MTDSLALVPAERRDAARAALKAAFGEATVSAMALLKGGVSGALIYRVEVGERAFALRLEPQRIPLHHRRRGFECMVGAADAGVAPAVRFADAETGVAVMDCVDVRPLSEHPAGAVGLVQALGALIARLQTTPSFPPLGDAEDMIASLLGGLAASGLFAPGLLDRHFDGLARLRQACPLDTASFVSSHNDPNPRNMLFDGRRVWLVDWELACRNDRLFDIAILTTELATTPELEDVLLAAVLGRAPDRADRARVTVTRLLTRLFYGCIALEVFADDRREAPMTSLRALSPPAFRAAVAEGRFADGSQIAYAFGLMSLAAFVDGLSATGFADMLSLAKGG